MQSEDALGDVQARTPVRFSDLKANQADKITAVRETLIDCGYDTLNKQAMALGLSPSTAWYVLNGHYKASGLSIRFKTYFIVANASRSDA
jgi:hypothetical protein